MSLSHAIMTALLDEDLSGYELAKRFDVSLGFFWSASHQQIYKTLKQLHEEGFLSAKDIDQQGKPNKRIYALTDSGGKNLDTWVLEQTRIKPAKDELLVKLYNIGRSDLGHIVAQIEVRRGEHVSRLALFRKIETRQYLDPENLPLKKKGVYLALQAGILQAETSIRWCDDSLSLLGR